MFFLATGIALSAPATTATSLVEDLVHGRYAAVEATFSSEVKAGLSEAKLRETWEQLTGQVGAYRSHGEPKVGTAEGFTIVLVPVEFEHAKLGVRVAYDTAGKVGGFFIVPLEQPPGASAPAPREDASTYVETETMAGAPGWPLPATLTVPRGKGPFPAVVLVHGSGPNDRDESSGGVKVFRDLALGLAARGVATLRYEKRTRVFGRKMTDPSITVKEEVIDDALAAAELLRKRAEVDPQRVFVLGHSLGGSLIPRIGARDDKLAGLISLEGAVRPVEVLVVEQTRYILEHTGAPPGLLAKKVAEAQEIARKITSPDLAKADPRTTIYYCNPPYWLDLRGYNPAEAAKALAQPLLIIQGGRDYQVTTADFDLWKAALAGRKNVTFKLYPKGNHLGVMGEGASVPAEYEKPDHVSSEIIGDVASWVKAQH